MQSETVEVAVVGGGLAGLTTALYLARGGRKVVVLEKAPHAGGRAITHRYDQFYFNQGPHALYNSVGVEILKEVGIDFSGGKPKVVGTAVYRGQTYSLPSGLKSIFDTKLLNAGEKFGLLGLLGKLMSVKPSALEGLSLRDWLNQTVKSAKVREFMEAFACVFTYTNAPESLDARDFVRQFRVALRGVTYLDYGWQTLVDGLQGIAAEAGVELRLSASVRAIEPDGQLRLADGSLIEAHTVVLATGPVEGNTLTGGQNAVLRHWSEAAVPVKAACLDLGLRRLPNPAVNFGLNLDPPLYFSVHTASGAKLAPTDNSTIHVLKYLHPNEPHNPQGDRRELETFLDRLQPGWRDEVVEQRFLPYMTVSNALVNVAQNGLSGRPSPATDWPNLYLAGDWVGPEGMLADAALASARQVARLILAQEITTRPVEYKVAG